MATTESRSGFRLPWAGEHRTDEQADGELASSASIETLDGTEPAAAPDSSDAGADMLQRTGPGTTAPDEAPNDGSGATDAQAAESTPAGTPESPATPSAPTPAAPGPAQPTAPPASGRKPTKFLADLTKAMQAAAEAERQETLELFQLEAKSFGETIHARSATEAEDLRKQADDDIASIREWSKQEIARIREETDQKISARKADLAEEIDDHAARIEREIDRVQKTVADYEQQMAAFFESLLAETDPTRFAALASSLPEPPSFELPTTEAASTPTDVAETSVAQIEQPAETAEATDGEAQAEPATAELSDADREAAFAAIEAAARAADAVDESAPVTADSDADPDPAADAAPAAGRDGFNGNRAPDPRLSALGLADFDAAEAEAIADLPSSDEEIPEIADEALAARLAGLVPADEGDVSAPAGSDTAPATAQTSVVVVGLVSVASIASFKRHLARVAGVRSVGVSSGPDGEFVFTVTHDPGLELRDVVPGVPGFGARVTEVADGLVRATAHDAESGA